MTGCNPRRLSFRIFESLPMILFTVAVALSLSANAAELPAVEAVKIEALIAAVEGMADAVFIRNGRAYDSAVAAEFLRRKWQAQALHVVSVEDFIEKVASVSSTTGRPYLMVFVDGREIPCSSFLREELARLQQTKQ